MHAQKIVCLAKKVRVKIFSWRSHENLFKGTFNTWIERKFPDSRYSGTLYQNYFCPTSSLQSRYFSKYFISCSSGISSVYVTVFFIIGFQFCQSF